MVVDLTVSNLLKASPTRSSRRLESFFQLWVCLFLPFPILLPLSRFNAAKWYSFSALVNIYSTSPWSNLPWAFLSLLQRTCVVIGYFVGDQPMRKFVAHTVVRSRKIVLGCWVGRLRPGLFVHGGEGGSTHCFGWLADWYVQLHSHSESSCWLYKFPTFTCARPSKRLERIYTTCVWLRPW